MQVAALTLVALSLEIEVLELFSGPTLRSNHLLCQICFKFLPHWLEVFALQDLIELNCLNSQKLSFFQLINFLLFRLSSCCLFLLLLGCAVLVDFLHVEAEVGILNQKLELILLDVSNFVIFYYSDYALLIFTQFDPLFSHSLRKSKLSFLSTKSFVILK